MHYNVPQFIDIEDRIVGPLTGKQLLWMFAMGGVLLILWASVDNKANFFIAGFPIAGVFLALAFYRPYGQPLSKFISAAFLFVVKPKIYIWQRGESISVSRSKKKLLNDNEISHYQKKKIKKEDLQKLVKILDGEK